MLKLVTHENRHQFAYKQLKLVTHQQTWRGVRLLGAFKHRHAMRADLMTFFFSQYGEVYHDKLCVLMSMAYVCTECSENSYACDP